MKVLAQAVAIPSWIIGWYIWRTAEFTKPWRDSGDSFTSLADWANERPDDMKQTDAYLWSIVLAGVFIIFYLRGLK